MINLSARKTGGGVVATLIRGDNHTTRLEIAVARNARDVDLGGLAWRVNICAADGRTDVYTPTEVVVDDREIRFGWLPGGIATAAVGLTEFTVVGMADAENPPVWKSDKQYLQIDDCVDAQPSGEQAAQLGELDKLIVFVRGELAGVLAAGKAAAEAAENARNLPFIGSDGMWRVWDAGKQAYVNTGVRAEGRDGAGAEAFADVKTRISNLENYEQRPFESTGDLVQIDNYEGMPMDCVTRIEPIQQGSGDPSPDNIRPISGRTSAKLTRAGKNLIPFTNTAQTISGVTFTPQSDGRIHIKGTATASVVYPLFGGWQQRSGIVIPAGVLFSPTVSIYGVFALLYYYDRSGKYASVTTQQTLAEQTPDASIFLQINSGTTVDGYFTPTLTVDGWSTAYEPYQGDTFAADFGQTVYGGVIDWNTGVLTVDRKTVAFDGSENWLQQNTNVANVLRWGLDIPDAKTIDDSAKVADHVSSHYKTVSANATFLRNNGISHTSDRTHIFDERYSAKTLADFKAYLSAQYAAGTPVQVCYKLAAPITIQLTPQQITALQGVNYIWSDAGETTVSGRKDVLWLGNYLPTATATTKGGVKVGKGLQMDGDVLGVDEGEGYKLIKEITLTEEQAGITQLVETFPAPGYDGIIMTVEKSAPPNTVSAFAGFGESTVKRATGGDLFWAGTNTGAKYVCYNMGGAWETYLHQGAAGDKSSMRGAVSSTNVSLAGADFNYIGYVRLYTFDAGGFPAGMNVKIYGKAATR